MAASLANIINVHCTKLKFSLKPLSANPTKCPNTLKQFLGNSRQQPTKYLGVFNHFVGLALKGLTVYSVNVTKSARNFIFCAVLVITRFSSILFYAKNVISNLTVMGKTCS